MSSEAGSSSSSDAVPGPTSEKGGSVLRTVCPYILGTELGERLAYFTVLLNGVNYMKRLGASSASAVTAASTISGCMYLLALIGGWLADARLGRYKTILAAAGVYIVGLALLTGSAVLPGIRVNSGENASVVQWTLFAICLFFICLGTSGIKANVASFGADQFDETKEEDQKGKESFFGWFYMFINIGALLASTVMVYIEDQGMWGTAFFMAGVSMVAATAVFALGRSHYTFKPAFDSPILRFLMISYTAARKRFRRDAYAPLSSELNSQANSNVRGRQSSGRHWLDAAIGDFCEEEVADVKAVYRLLPIMALSILIWASTSQLDGLALLQANQSDRRIEVFGHRTQFPSASLVIFNTTTIIVLVPLYDRVLVPAMRRYLNYHPTSLQRIGCGWFLAVVSTLIFYFLEKIRLDIYRDGKFHIDTVDGDEVEVVEMSVMWLMIPRVLHGICEVLASVSLLNFYYSEAPESMKSIMAALNLLSMSLGGYLLSLMIYTIHRTTDSTSHPWLPDNLNEGHLDYLFLLLTGMAFLSFIAFLYTASRFQHRVPRPEHLQQQIPLTSINATGGGNELAKEEDLTKCL